MYFITRYGLYEYKVVREMPSHTIECRLDKNQMLILSVYIRIYFLFAVVELARSDKFGLCQWLLLLSVWNL